MSYSVDWINPIYDRTYGDVITAEGQRELTNPKGCYNYIDLNRIENNTKYVMEDMHNRRIIHSIPSLAIKLNWAESDVPTKENMERIISNVNLLMDLSNPIIHDDFHIIYESTQITYSLANAIEYNLELMKNQPELPIESWLLRINEGIIINTRTSSEYMEENEVVNIKAIPEGVDNRFKTFTHWSGNSDDLQYVGDVNNPETTYTMQYHDNEGYIVELTANFRTAMPRTLTLNGGIIYDSIGGSSRQFLPGQQILILANIASEGKSFYGWQGTQEGLDNLTGGVEPSTSLLVMPDKDVTLTSTYINAGKHKVTIDGGIQGWYDYGEYVTIYPNDRGRKWQFAYWSGDTGYLEDVTSNYFEMPDVNLNFTANWTYTPDQYQLVINNGSGSGTYDDNARVNISAQAPNENMGFVYWEIDEGYGRIYDEYNPNTVFYMSTSDVVVIAYFGNKHTVTINNYNNSGNAEVIDVIEGTYHNINTTEVVGDKILDYWLDENNERILSLYFDIVIGSEDRVFTAVYRDRQTYTLTVNNGTGGGQYLEKSTVRITANTPPDGKRFNYWNRSSDVFSIDNSSNATTTIITGYDDCSVTATYTDIPTYIYHNLTVNNGSGSGAYYEGQRVTCYGNTPPAEYEFSHWEEHGEVIPYAYQTYYFYMGTVDRNITAVYTPIPYFNVTVIDGTGSGRFIRNSYPTISMNPAPEGYKFLQWDILDGGDNAISEALAETTTIRNLTQNVTVKATYYIPNPEIQYSLTIINKAGQITTSNYNVGEQIDIYADSPDDGYTFYKWIGDTQYLIDKYSTPTVVNMPAKNIELQMEYRREDFVTTYHVLLHGGELLVETDDEGDERWDIEGEFEEFSEVRIRAIDIPIGWKFNTWKNDDDGGQSVSTVSNLLSSETTVHVEDFDITLTRDVIERDKFAMSIRYGEISGSYYDDNPVQIYFNLENTDTMHYQFVEWIGDTSQLTLFDTGEPFNTNEPGTADYPQTIRMPNRNINIEAVYNISYAIVVNDEILDYCEECQELTVSAEELENKRFTYWTGDTDCIDNKYNPNIIVTVPNRTVTLRANYHNITDNNNIGYLLTSLLNSDTINIENIDIISGEICIGFILTDINGHIYAITSIENNIANIIKLTKIQGGQI